MDVNYHVPYHRYSLSSTGVTWSAKVVLILVAVAQLLSAFG